MYLGKAGRKVCEPIGAQVDDALGDRNAVMLSCSPVDAFSYAAMMDQRSGLPATRPAGRPRSAAAIVRDSPDQGAAVRFPPALKRPQGKA